MSDFANLRDAGAQLAPLLTDGLADLPDPVLLPVLPNGVPVVLGVLDAWPAEVRALPATRGDDGVETGTVARSAARALRDVGVASATLAVPVCPREALADLALRYDRVVAVARPLVRRDLAWHYDAFDTVDEQTALRLLAARLP